MKQRPVATALAIASGLIVLIGYFIPLPILLDIRLQLVQWAVIVAGTAALVGVANLVSVHSLKIQRRDKGSLYSLLLIISLITTLAIGILGIWFDPHFVWMQTIVNAIIFPVEASLMALLAVTLVYASIRLLRHRTDLMTIVFLVTAVLMLGASVVMPLIFPSSGDILSWTSLSLAGGGARGLLLGVALGALTTGLRVLFGVDRPYGGK
jgi:cytochrome bd-type quinol oxidase subunit 2